MQCFSINIKAIIPKPYYSYQGFLNVIDLWDLTLQSSQTHSEQRESVCAENNSFSFTLIIKIMCLHTTFVWTVK